MSDELNLCQGCRRGGALVDDRVLLPEADLMGTVLTVTPALTQALVLVDDGQEREPGRRGIRVAVDQKCLVVVPRDALEQFRRTIRRGGRRYDDGLLI